jgi:hypothetical protein
MRDKLAKSGENIGEKGLTCKGLKKFNNKMQD